MMKCTKCGCFMKLKSTLKTAKCPVGHWWYMSKEEYDDYLARIKQRWDSSLLSDKQNEDIWNDVWMTPKKEDNEVSPEWRVFT